MTKHYTMIGSRDTPTNIQGILRRLAWKLGSEGWVVRSGGADGADSCAENTGWGMEIYLPWMGFNNRSVCDPRYIVVPHHKLKYKAEKIASETHPAWSKCRRGVKELHTRNVYQVLGDDLNTPSKFVVCWAKPSGNEGDVQGGTGTAVRLALQHGIPVYNLYHEEHLKRIIKYLED
jgi:hypothetical protein